MSDTLDKQKLLDRLKVWIETCNDEIASAVEEEDFVKAAVYQMALNKNQHLESMILRGVFDTKEPE